MREINKTLKEVKTNIEAIKKTQTEGILVMENLMKRAGTTNARLTKRLEVMEKRIWGIEDMLEEIDTSDKENVKSKNS